MHGLDPAVRGRDPAEPAAALQRRPSTSRPWAESGKPVHAFVPEHDDYLQPAEAAERFAAIPQAEVVPFPGGKHLWVGDAERVLDEIVRRVAPDVAVPLPTPGTARWRPRTPAPTTRTTSRRTATCPVPGRPAARALRAGQTAESAQMCGYPRTSAPTRAFWGYICAALG